MDCPIGTDIPHAAALLREGGLVALPTETVYGLGANALDPRAVAGIFAAKERPFFDPLIVHVAGLKEITRIVADFPASARELAARFWPGPLTLVLPRQSIVPDLVTSGLNTVAVRIPRHGKALELIRQAGCPIAAPSANLFGQISPTTAEHVARQLSERIDYILDGGPCSVGLESTVLELLPRPRLLRPGGVPVEELEAILGPVEVAAPESKPEAVGAPSPGMLPQHYAPRTSLRILPMSLEWPADLPSRVGCLTFREPPRQACTALEILSPTGDLAEAAANLFAALRRLDDADVDVILAEPVPLTGLGRAIQDRLNRAAH